MQRLLGTVCFAAVALTAANGRAQTATVDAALEQAAATSGPNARIPVIVELRSKADLRAALRGKRAAQRATVIERLKNHAAETQQSLLQDLDSAGANEVKNLWLVNSVAALVPARQVQRLANRPDVESVRLDGTFSAPVMTEAASAAEWNVARIGAPLAWDDGVRGQGIVVANMDTGVDVYHPDLQPRWRGGSNSWFDPYGQNPTPRDYAGNSSGHGTQTMSLMSGGDADGTAIGVAPEARWIAAKIFSNAGTANLSKVHQAFQWLLDPDGDPNTDDPPDVVLNSWGFEQNPGQCNLEFEPDLRILKVAGIAVVFSAGNGGPGGYSSVSPGNNPSALSVGAIDQADTLADFSARGPSACDGSVYPDLIAPGDGTKAADLSFGGELNYVSALGTSFAAPHVAGAMALLLSAYPETPPHVLEAALDAGADPLGRTEPTEGYGSGLVNVPDAATWLAGDIDSDGAANWQDCDYTDPTVHPGAMEIKFDGLDQDCNGYDLTISVTKATYSRKRGGMLVVEATSFLNNAANLSVVGFGPMTWNAKSSRWTLSLTPAANPGNVTVAGVEGEVPATVSATK